MNAEIVTLSSLEWWLAFASGAVTATALCLLPRLLRRYERRLPQAEQLWPSNHPGTVVLRPRPGQPLSAVRVFAPYHARRPYDFDREEIR